MAIIEANDLLLKLHVVLLKTGWRTYQRPDEKSAGHGVGWSPIISYLFSVPQEWEEVPVSIADLGGTEIDLIFGNPKEGRLFVIVAPVLRFADSANEAETPEIVTAQQPEILFRPTKRCRINEGADATVYSPSSSPEVSGKFYGLPFEMNEENGLARAVSLFAMVLERVKRRMKSVANKRSAEILTSVATEMHLQLQNAESHSQTDVRKLSGIGKTKKRRLETKFQGD